MINTILNLLRSDGYITVNKILACNIGLSPATIFSEMAAKYNYFSIRNELKNGYFYCTIPDLHENTGLKKDEQDTAINKLIRLGLIEKKVMKLKGDEAPKRYFKIVSDMNLLLKYLKSVDNTDNFRIAENPKSTIGKSEINIGKSAPIRISNKNKTNKNNKKHTDLKNLCEEIQNILGEKISQKKIKELIDSEGMELLRQYMDNWDKYRTFAKHGQAAYFIYCLQNRVPVPLASNNKNVPKYADFPQRKYDDDFYNRFYANLNNIELE